MAKVNASNTNSQVDTHMVSEFEIHRSVRYDVRAGLVMRVVVMYSADKSHYPMKWNLIFKNDKLEDMYRRYNWDMIGSTVTNVYYIYTGLVVLSFLNQLLFGGFVNWRLSFVFASNAPFFISKIFRQKRLYVYWEWYLVFMGDGGIVFNYVLEGDLIGYTPARMAAYFVAYALMIPFLFQLTFLPDRIDLMESRGGGSLVVWMFLFTFMASCGMYRIDAVNRRSFLAKLELRRSLDVAEARKDDVQKMVEGKIAIDEETKGWLLQDFTTAKLSAMNGDDGKRVRIKSSRGASRSTSRPSSRLGVAAANVPASNVEDSMVVFRASHSSRMGEFPCISEDQELKETRPSQLDLSLMLSRLSSDLVSLIQLDSASYVRDHSDDVITKYLRALQGRDSTRNNVPGAVNVNVDALEPEPEPTSRAPLLLGSNEFDAFLYADEMKSDLLPCATLYFMSMLNLSVTLSPSPGSLMKLVYFVQRIEKLYHSNNSYHNVCHAIDVAVSCINLLHMTNLVDYCTPWELTAVVLAAICHDVDHPARTNAFLVASRDPLAVRYNDRSVLENHHACTAFSLLYSKTSMVLYDHDGQAVATTTNTDFLEDWFPHDVVVQVRELMIRLILATDMSRHFEYVSQLNEKLAEGDFGVGRAAFSVAEKRHFLLQLLMKVSDLGHVLKPLPLTIEWTKRVNEEFFDQGDSERERGIPVGTFMDRTKKNIPKSQDGYLQYVVLPLVKGWCDITGCPTVLEQLNKTIVYWKDLVAANCIDVQMGNSMRQSSAKVPHTRKSVDKST